MIGEIVVATMPFVAVGGALWLAERREHRREETVARQIALTDAVHRALGAVAAPQVTRRWDGTWIVRMPVPLDDELVGVLSRLTHGLFAQLDRTDSPRVDVLFTRPEVPPRRRPARPAAGSAPRGLRPLGARLG